MPDPVRILILEDDPDLRQVLEGLLSAEGYVVDSSSRAKEAVARARAAAYDLIIVDIRMEGMDGLDALKEVREWQPDIRSMVMTGYSTEADSIRAIRLGVGEYLKKPFELDVFLDAVNKVIARQAAEERLQRQEQQTRRSLLWALKQLAQCLEESNLPGPDLQLEDLLTRCDKLCLRLSLPRESAELIQVVLLLVATRRFTGSVDTDALPPAVQVALRSLEERWDGSGGRGVARPGHSA